MSSFRNIIDKRFAVMLIFTLIVLSIYHLTREADDSLPPYPIWLDDKDFIKNLLSESISTKYNYIKLYKVRRAPGKGVVETPYYGPGGGYFRQFSIYQYDPEEVAPIKNYRIDGWINQDGKIKVFNHCRADTVYL